MHSDPRGLLRSRLRHRFWVSQKFTNGTTCFVTVKRQRHIFLFDKAELSKKVLLPKSVSTPCQIPSPTTILPSPPGAGGGEFTATSIPFPLIRRSDRGTERTNPILFSFSVSSLSPCEGQLYRKRSESVRPAGIGGGAYHFLSFLVYCATLVFPHKEKKPYFTETFYNITAYGK